MLISIVIPVYNAEKYLSRCLESILSQTYKNIEVIIVNDGSTDKSQQIIKTYQKKSKKVRVFNQGNVGVSKARNLGIKYCKGDYILFLDSDDWIDEDYIEKSIDFLKDNKVDLLLLPYIREYKNKSVKNYIFRQKEFYLKNKNLVQNSLLRKLFGPVGEELKKPAYIDDLSPCWGKLYRTSICKNIKFVDVSKIGAEDVWFNINYVSKINTAAYIGNAFYHYNKENSDSLIHKKNSDVFKKRQKLYESMKNFIKSHGLNKEYKIAVENRIIIDLIGISNNIYSSGEGFWNKYHEEKILLNNVLYYEAFRKFDFECLPFRWKIFLKLCDKKHVLILSIFVSLGEKLKPFLK